MSERAVWMAIVWGAVLIGGIVLLWNRRRGGHGSRRGPGPGAAGAIYDMLNEDKRRAIEIIVEQKAEATDPETADDQPPPAAHTRTPGAGE